MICVTFQEVKILKDEVATRLNSNETAELLKEKDDQIKGLMEEGESELTFHDDDVGKQASHVAENVYV